MCREGGGGDPREERYLRIEGKEGGIFIILL